MRFNLFGRHLYTQLVWPLVLGATIVAVLATIAAVRVIESQVLDWVDRNGQSVASVVSTRLGHRATSVERSLELISADPRFIAAIEAGDEEAMEDYLAFAELAIRADTLMLLGDEDRVIVSVGETTMPEGSVPFPAVGDLAGSAIRLAELAGESVVTVTAPVADDLPGERLLVATIALDDARLADIGLGLDAVFGLADGDGTLIALSAPDTVPEDEVQSLLERVASEVPGALAGRDLDEGAVDARFGDAGYRMVLHPLNDVLPNPSGYVVVSIVSTALADEARATTFSLIGMWFTLGLVALAGLSWYLRRTVSDPLVRLSKSATRVSGGDFQPVPAIAGHNEIAMLADDFNRMTDSLRERSESLTKKVLELATLYEMSRSLGSTLELDALLDSVLDSAMRIFDVEVGYVTMVDRETGTLEPISWRGVDLSRMDEASIRGSMAEWVVREGRPLIFNPSSEEGESRASAADPASGAVAALCVPLLSSEGTLGAITVGSHHTDRRFASDDVRLLSTIANHVTIAVGNIGLFSSVQEAYLATVRALAAAVDAKDPYTRGHSDGVARYALMIGEAAGVSQEQMTALEMAAYLHDIGKIGISEDILLKPGKLTDAEMSQMRHHPLIGANILKPVAFPWPIAPIVRHHHEHYDGGGYPAGLRGEEIPFLARVLTVADAFEAMVADRPYRRGRSQQEAILELRRCSGSQFDPRVVDTFIEVLESVGTLTPYDDGDDDDIGCEEAEAVLVALCDGMFASFRRLGGPRLASNLEGAINEAFAAHDAAFSFNAGRLVVEGRDSDGELTDRLVGAVQIIAERIEDASGSGLAEHFLGEAVSTLPERMRRCAARLGFPASL